MPSSSCNVLIVTEPDGAFQSAGQSWLTIDAEEVATLLRDEGWSVKVLPIDKLLDEKVPPDAIALYTSANDPTLRAYIREVLYFAQKRMTIVPSYELLLAHENKGVQELLRTSLGLGGLLGHYHVDFDSRAMSPPYVFKSVTGAGSSGVSLVSDQADERSIARRQFKTELMRRLKLEQRKRRLSSDQFRRYEYYYKAFRPYVTQEFIPGLKGDFKILVFGTRYYVLARTNRPGDFRASGGGRLDLQARCTEETLEFCRNIVNVLDAPFMSLDVAESAQGPKLIEFQGLNFGPTTLTRSTGYFEWDGSSFVFREGESDLTQAFAQAYHAFLSRKCIDQ